jgi:hypothetical protein
MISASNFQVNSDLNGIHSLLVSSNDITAQVCNRRNLNGVLEKDLKAAMA